MKRILSLIIIFSTLVCILNAVPALSAEVRVSDVLTEQAEIIQEYWNTINLGNWYDWVETYAPAAREEYMELVSSPEYVNSKTGIMAIESAELLNFSLLSNEYASTVYTELLPYYASSDTVACYKVTANIVADESSPYFRTGKCERVMILVKESGHWYVGARTRITLIRLVSRLVLALSTIYLNRQPYVLRMKTELFIRSVSLTAFSTLSATKLATWVTLSKPYVQMQWRSRCTAGGCLHLVIMMPVDTMLNLEKLHT